MKDIADQETIDVGDMDVEAFNDFAIEQGWSDGMPLYVPTEDKVARFVETVRGDAVYRDSALSAAHQAVEDRLKDSSANPEVIPEFSDAEKRRLLVEFDSRRRLALRQRAIEDWLADWRLAEER